MPTFAATYRATSAAIGGACPIEAGLIGRLADYECRHGRLAFDTTPACGCWPEEAAGVRELPLTSRDGTPAARVPAAA
jgi:hypothetical protein